jgi:hypothetical protein
VSEPFEAEIARIGARVGTSGDRLRGLLSNLNRAVSALADARPAGLATEERGALLAFEEILIEALTRASWLLHERGDDEDARECLALIRRLRDLVQSAIEGE